MNDVLFLYKNQSISEFISVSRGVGSTSATKETEASSTCNNNPLPHRILGKAILLASLGLIWCVCFKFRTGIDVLVVMLSRAGNRFKINNE